MFEQSIDLCSACSSKGTTMLALLEPPRCSSAIELPRCSSMLVDPCSSKVVTPAAPHLYYLVSMCISRDTLSVT